MADKKETAAMSERLAALEGEVARLRREHADMLRALGTANDRVRELETARDDALNRIDWAIDSIHNVIGPS